MITDLAPCLNRPRHHPVRRLSRIVGGAVAVTAVLVVSLSAVAYGGDGGMQTVTVRPGDTLWTIASTRYPGDADVRGRIDEILSANHLTTVDVRPGQQLVLPEP